MTNGVTHIGFADESNWNTGRFRSLGLVTTKASLSSPFNQELATILDTSGITEFKWERLRSAKTRFAAEKLCQFAVEKAIAGQLRIDVLIWDIEDSRHKIPKRDDIANLQRMYFHLFRNVLRLRWPKGAVWRLHPDEHTAMDWNTVEDFLEMTSIRTDHTPSLFNRGLFHFRLKAEFGIQEIQPLRSIDTPLLQLADLFAGMGAFSHEQFGLYQIWLHHKKRTEHPSLFLEVEENDNDKEVKFSRSKQERFQVLSVFDKMCKAHKLGVSLKTWQGLRTPNPHNPLNFWLYEPQHPNDKAPTRSLER